jgi:hypothetical protein
MIDKTSGRTLAGGPKKSQETTLGVTQVLTLALIVGFAAIGGGLLLLMKAII